MRARRQGLTTEGVMRALAAARDGARVLYVCPQVKSARRACRIAEDMAEDAMPAVGKLRLDFRSGGRLSFAPVQLDPDRADPRARIALDHAALKYTDPHNQCAWADLAARRGLA